MYRLPHSRGLRALRIPKMHDEYQRTAARVIIEHRLHRRVRQNTAIPIELTVNADGREGRWQRAGRHDMTHIEFRVAAVEIAHLRGTNVRCSHRQSAHTTVDNIKVDQVSQRPSQGSGAVIANVISAEPPVRPEQRQRVRLKEPVEPTEHRDPGCQLGTKQRRPYRQSRPGPIGDAVPERTELRQPLGFLRFRRSRCH
jgi:hypothetical protein